MLSRSRSARGPISPFGSIRKCPLRFTSAMRELDTELYSTTLTWRLHIVPCLSSGSSIPATALGVP